MSVWFVFALMTAAAVLAVLWPLGRRAPARQGRSQGAVYAAQLKELEADEVAGLIGPSEAEAARVEVARRLLAAEARGPEVIDPGVATRSRRFVAALALVAIPLSSLGLYAKLGAPEIPAQHGAGRSVAATESDAIESLVGRVEAHLARHPDDGHGWDVLAPVYMRLGRFDDAARALRQALTLNGETPGRQADLGEALVAAANGIVTSEAASAFDRARQMSAGDAKARFYQGLAAEQDGRAADAAETWRALVAETPPEAPLRPVVQRMLARLEQPPDPKAPGPSAADIAAANELAPSDREGQIRGMVERLADRLHRDGGDGDGWSRLVRSYLVLGERDRAVAAVKDARAALAPKPDDLARFETLVKGLGLGG